MRKLGAILLTLCVAAPPAALLGQVPERPTPWFTLSLAEAHLGDNYSADDHELLVTYANSPNATQKDVCVNTSWVYQMVVLRDGVPVQKKTPSKKEDTGETPGRYKIPMPRFTEANACQGATQGIPPGASIKIPLWVSSFYDMTEPGTYTITVKRETFPYEPAKSVTVWSNTIEIVVPQPVAETPQ